MSQAVTILYFAWVRQKIGKGMERLALPEGVSDVGGLVSWLSAQGPGHAAAFANPKLVRAAVNQDFVTATHPVAPGDEIAFFPPVTGG
ncbi:molybdopterin converting factor subunit 1 [Acetobacteraceae bacterium H6797]|nr:molybdopterin converting factor subunit 1 [Acetobacteraceae bacterium H6797]